MSQACSLQNNHEVDIIITLTLVIRLSNLYKEIANKLT